MYAEGFMNATPFFVDAQNRQTSNAGMKINAEPQEVCEKMVCDDVMVFLLRFNLC